MRIGVIVPYSFDFPGGVQQHAVDLAETLNAQGHTVQILAPCRLETVVPDFVVKGGPAFAIRYNGSVARLAFGARVERKVRQFISAGNFDVLHIHQPLVPGYSLTALRLANGPIVATYHASSVGGSKLLKTVRPLFAQWSEKIHAGIAVSEVARRWNIEHIGGDSVVIPNGVHVKRYLQAAKLAATTAVFGQEAMAAADLEQAQVVREFTAAHPCELVFLGRIDEPRKGLAVLLQAVGLLDEADKQRLRLTIVGAGTPQPVPAGVQAQYVGKVADEEKIAYLGNADIYCAPNTGGESFGIVLVEAMAAGCAVLASDLEAFTQVSSLETPTAAGETAAAVHFRNEDPAALAEQLHRMLANPRAVARMGQLGAEHCWSFDWSTVATKVLQVYETVAEPEGVRL